MWVDVGGILTECPWLLGFVRFRVGAEFRSKSTGLRGWVGHTPPSEAGAWQRRALHYIYLYVFCTSIACPTPAAAVSCPV
jgi:hypothetical protein